MQKIDKTIPNDAYQKNPPFYRLDTIYKTQAPTTSFLYLNTLYFPNRDSVLSIPPEHLEHDFVPDFDGCITYEFERGNIEINTMNRFQQVYSLNGKFAEIYDKKYLVGYDYENMLNILCKNDADTIYRAYLIMEHDKYLLNLIKARLVGESLLSQKNIQIVNHYIADAFNLFCTLPLNTKPIFIPELADKEWITQQAKNSTITDVYNKLVMRLSENSTQMKNQAESLCLPKQEDLNTTSITGSIVLNWR